MVKTVLKQPLFVIGASIILLLVIASVVTGIIYHGKIPHLYILYKDGDLIGAPPFKPSQVPPFGTDSAGNLLFQELLMGAKYTIGIAALVAFLRVGLSLFFGLIFQRYLMKASAFFSGLVDCFHYVPLSLVGYLTLSSVLISVTNENKLHVFLNSYSERVFFELIILTLLSVPALTLFIANETDAVYKKEFIRSVELLGGRRNYILRRHLLPLLWPKLLLTFIEQMIQTLILLIHLGLFKLLFGGTYVFSVVAEASNRYQSKTGEWSGLIGSSYDYLFIDPRVILIPLFAFALLILSLNFILDGLKKAIEQGRIRVKPNRYIKEKDEIHITEDSFKPVHRSA